MSELNEITSDFIKRSPFIVLATADREVHIEQCFFHCVEVFPRSQLWKPETWTPHKIVSFGKQFEARSRASDDVDKQIDEAIEPDHRENL